MGRAASSLFVRPFKNWNVESSAHKIVDKSNKPKVAPRHPSTKDQIDSFVQENKDLLISEVKEKNEMLHDRLKGMVVEVSKFGEIQSKRSKKKLPEDRSKVSDPEFGYLEPDIVKEGCLSIKQAMELLSKHFSDPSKYTAQDIAKDYKLSIQDVEKVLTYYNVFLLQVPKKEVNEDTDQIVLPFVLRQIVEGKEDK